MEVKLVIDPRAIEHLYHCFFGAKSRGLPSGDFRNKGNAKKILESGLFTEKWEIDVVKILSTYRTQ